MPKNEDTPKKDLLFEHLKRNRGIITYKDCKTIGLPTIYLTRFEQAKYLTRIEKGIYLSTHANYDEYYFFQYHYPRTIFSYISALYLHGITDEIPQYYEVTVPKGYRFRRPAQNVYVHTVPKEFLNLGAVSAITPMGGKVRAYNFERIVCDMIYNRSTIDTELFVKTLQTYSTYPKQDIAQLYEYASRMDILDEVKKTLEVLL